MKLLPWSVPPRLPCWQSQSVRLTASLSWVLATVLAAICASYFVVKECPTYIVGVSKDPSALVRAPISCYEAVDYTWHDIFSMKELISEPFDLIDDLAGHGYIHLKESAAWIQSSLVDDCSSDWFPL